MRQPAASLVVIRNNFSFADNREHRANQAAANQAAQPERPRINSVNNRVGQHPMLVSHAIDFNRPAQQPRNPEPPRAIIGLRDRQPAMNREQQMAELQRIAARNEIRRLENERFGLPPPINNGPLMNEFEREMER